MSLEKKPENKVILKVDKLNKYFKKQNTLFKAVNNVSFDVKEGDFFGIIGESGSGKSTTGKVIIRLLQANGGTITFDDKIISQEKISRKTKKWLTKNIQMIFQDPMSSLNPKKNVLNLISEPLIINKEINSIANEIIKNHNIINPYYQFSYKRKDFHLTKEFHENYYVKVLNEYQTLLQNIKNFNIEKENLETINFDFSEIFSTSENNLKELTNLIHPYSKEIKNIYDEILAKHQSGKAFDEELKLQAADEKLKLLTETHKKPNSVIKLEEKLNAQKEIFDKFKSDFSEEYNEDNVIFSKSILSSYKTDLNALKQACNKSTSFTKYLVISAKILKAELFIENFKIITKQKYLLNHEIISCKEKLEEIISNTTKELINKTLTLRNFEIEKQEKISEFLKKELINNNTAEQLKEINSKEEIKELISKVNIKDEDFDNINSQIETTMNFIEKEFENRDKFNSEEMLTLVNSFVTKSENINSKYEEQKNKYDDSINEIENQLIDQRKKIIEWKLTKEHKTKKELFQKAEKEYEIALEECREFYKKTEKDFLSETQPKIDALREEINNHKKSIKKLKLEISLITKKYRFLLIKKTWKEKSDLNFIQRLKTCFEAQTYFAKEVDVKLKNLKALDFEYDNIMDEIQLTRMLRSENKLVLLLNKKFLKKVLIKQKVYESLKSVGLKTEHAYRYPHEFSGGQRQRIVIARALINNPKLIIADEPISALDVSVQAQVINIMKNLAKEKNITFLFVAHDLSMVHYACNRMIIMHNGRVVEKGNTDAIFSNPVHPYTISLIKAAPQLSKIHVNLAAFSQLENYSDSYSETNKPIYHDIKSDVEHQVFATESQIKKWKNQ